MSVVDQLEQKNRPEGGAGAGQRSGAITHEEDS